MNEDKIIADIKAIRAANPSLYLGLRWHHCLSRDFTPMMVGDIAPNSYQWEGGEPTDEELCGTCAVTLEDIGFDGALEQIDSYRYVDGLLVLIGSEYHPVPGFDEHEIVLRDAAVLATW